MRPQVKSTLADRAIPPQTLPSINLLDRCVHSNPEKIERPQQLTELLRPALLLNNVLHQQIIPRVRKGRDRPMKAAEKLLSRLPPSLGIQRPKPRIRQLIRSVITERRTQRRPKPHRNCRLPRARRPVQHHNPATSRHGPHAPSASRSASSDRTRPVSCPIVNRSRNRRLAPY